MDKKDLWNAVLAELQLSLSSANFQTWFKGKTDIVIFDGNQIEIGCNSSYTRDWLEQRYQGQLKAILDRLTEKQITLTFKVEKELANQTSTKHVRKPEPTDLLFPQENDSAVLSEKVSQSKLNPNYTFENFIVGSSNQLAFAVAQAIAENPSKAYNPFFVYGGVGLGKTHLMHSIGHEALKKNIKLKTLYCTSESFTNEMIEAIQNRRTKEFRSKYRGVDILIIDDIQFIAGRETTQEEFFHTFNELYNNGKQIILSSDRPPSDIAKLEERLRSRFEGGMIADIQQPDVDMREAILLSKIRRQNLDIPQEVLHYLAQSVSSSIRDLEGTLLRIVTQAKINNSSVSLELARSFITQRLERTTITKATPKEVLDLICSYFNIRHADIKGTSRVSKYVLPRQLTMYILRNDLGLQFENIADLLGKKDHTTVMHGVDKIATNVEKSDKLRGLVADIRAKLYN
jgi:chromosomal replication initiator protein